MLKVPLVQILQNCKVPELNTCWFILGNVWSYALHLRANANKNTWSMASTNRHEDCNFCAWLKHVRCKETFYGHAYLSIAFQMPMFTLYLYDSFNYIKYYFVYNFMLHNFSVPVIPFHNRFCLIRIPWLWPIHSFLW